MLIKASLIALLLIFQLHYLLGSKTFRLGRRYGGNVVPPKTGWNETLPPALWFKQRLDHFNPTEIRTWKQRYYVNEEFYDRKHPGPIFLMIGGEGAARANWMVKGTWIEYAKKLGALCFQVEHRFYGESHPTDDLSTKNLRYLSSHQALADLAMFITAMNDEYKLIDPKWITFGGSYSGSLSAWMRLKYPNLVYGAVSSSGPLLAKVDFMEYYEVVLGALREVTGDDSCERQLKEAYKQVRNLMANKPSVIEKEFKVCKPFSGASSDDLKNFYSQFADDFAEVVQYNNDNRMDSIIFPPLNIRVLCDVLTNTNSKPAYKRLAELSALMLSQSNQTCLDYSYSSSLEPYKNETWNSDGGAGRQWFYQTCTEFGFYQTSDKVTDIFGDNFGLDFYVQQCEQIFGTKFNKRFVESSADWTNSAYGALDIDVPRIVFVHGSVDPWHALGITSTRENYAPAIFIQGTAHCADMYAARNEDLPQLKKARVEVEQYLQNWITATNTLQIPSGRGY